MPDGPLRGTLADANPITAEAVAITAPSIPTPAVRRATPFGQWILYPPCSDFVGFMEPGERPLLWRNLDLYANSQDMGRSLFSGTLATRNRLWSEVEWELSTIGSADRAVAHVLHAVVADDKNAWSLMAVGPGDIVASGSSASNQFLRHFENVTLPTMPPGYDWRTIFAVTRRLMSMQHFTIFEAGAKHPLQNQGSFSTDVAVAVCTATHNALYDLLNQPVEQSDDAHITPGLYRRRLVPMASGLARYALMFYVSSLVRYKPDQIDPRTKPRDAWLLSAFTDQSSLPLLLNALSGILGKWYLFAPRQGYRL